ncbi:MAG: VWA domain-containing protein [Deltaproteobacteria bacterium]|nr:VWA domain-containing protein [Deltaproteobacteria bacterium]
MTLHLAADRTLVRTSSPCHRFVLATIRAPRAEGSRPRVSVRVAFVLDRSGSMAGGKFELAREAVDLALTRLTDSDRFTVVVFDDVIDVVQSEVPATDANRRTASQRLREIEARGTTNLYRGWLTGCQAVGTPDPGDSVARCLLLTDGLANVEVTSPEELERHAGALRSRGVSTSTFGIGAGFDEALLGRMADAGGGAFQYIGNAEQIPGIMARELGETLEITARDVVLEVAAPDGVTAQVVGPWICRREGAGWRIALPDLVSAQELQIPVRLGFTPAAAGAQVTVRFVLHDRETALGKAADEVTFLYADDKANDAQPRAVDVDRVVAARHASLAREKAVQLNRNGRYAEASEALLGVARKVKSYAGEDAVLREVASTLQEDARAFRAPKDESFRKQAFFAAKAMSTGHAEDGFRRRVDPWAGGGPATHPLPFLNGHLFLEVDGDLWMLDTGSPASFGQPGAVRIAGERFPMPDTLLGLTAASLSGFLGVRCVGFLGSDVIGRLDWILDGHRGIARVWSGELDRAGASVRLDTAFALPVVHASVRGKDRRMFLDFGAQVSYLRPELLDGFPPADTVTDFYPGLGTFQVETRDVDISLGPVSLAVRCGVLPDALSHLLASTDVDGILGNQLLHDREIGYFPRRRLMTL